MGVHVAGESRQERERPGTHAGQNLRNGATHFYLGSLERHGRDDDEAGRGNSGHRRHAGRWRCRRDRHHGHDTRVYARRYSVGGQRKPPGPLLRAFTQEGVDEKERARGPARASVQASSIVHCGLTGSAPSLQEGEALPQSQPGFRLTLAGYYFLGMAAACQSPEHADAPTVPVTSDAAGGASEPFAMVDASSLSRPEATTVPVSWCGRADPDPEFRRCTFSAIAYAYWDAQYGACETRGLIGELDGEQSAAWGNYLTDYTTALAGCDIEPGRNLPGGIDTFGPANTLAIGIPRPVLGQDDVARLIDQYLAPFTELLALSGGERSLVEAHLWRAAASQIDPNATALISACDTAAPTGG